MIGLHDLSISSLNNPERHNGVAFPLLPRAQAHVSTVEKCVFAFTAFTLLENQGVMVERFCL